MRPTIFTRMMLAIAIVVAVVGAVDAALADAWDLVGIFVALALLTGVLLVRTLAARPLVPVRADLVRWLGRRAAVTGESTERLADRAIAAYRDGLLGDEGESVGTHA